jgi:hypothetical protein
LGPCGEFDLSVFCCFFYWLRLHKKVRFVCFVYICFVLLCCDSANVLLSIHTAVRLGIHDLQNNLLLLANDVF